MHLIPEKPAAWEELPRRNRRWRVLKNWALKPGVLRVGEFVDVGSGTCAWRCRSRRAAPGDRCRADAACEFLARAPIKSAALLWFGDTRVTNSACGGRKTRRVLIGSRAVGRGRRRGLGALLRWIGVEGECQCGVGSIRARCRDRHLLYVTARCRRAAKMSRNFSSSKGRKCTERTEQHGDL